jgi:hypothetical protein
MFYIFVMFAVACGTVNGFNIDLDMPILKQIVGKAKPSYFGYSLAQHYVKSTKTH